VRKNEHFPAPELNEEKKKKKKKRLITTHQYQSVGE
jgi:hypothetical protein